MLSTRDLWGLNSIVVLVDLTSTLRLIKDLKNLVSITLLIDSPLKSFITSSKDNESLETPAQTDLSILLLLLSTYNNDGCIT